VGSTNLDPRSFRLNFEFNLEIYSQELAAQLKNHFDQTRINSRELTLAENQERPFSQKILDATAKLFSPFL